MLGVVFLNGGLFPETHRPTTGQSVLRAVPTLAAWTPQFVLNRALDRTTGPGFHPPAEWTQTMWQMIARKGGRLIIGTLLRYMDDRQVRVGCIFEGDAFVLTRFDAPCHSKMQQSGARACAGRLIRQTRCKHALSTDRQTQCPESTSYKDCERSVFGAAAC